MLSEMKEEKRKIKLWTFSKLPLWKHGKWNAGSDSVSDLAYSKCKVMQLV